MQLLFTVAYWHGLAGLHMHTEDTVKLLDDLTTVLGQRLREFKATTCQRYQTRESKREAAKRVQQSARSAGRTAASGGKGKKPGAKAKDAVNKGKDATTKGKAAAIKGKGPATQAKSLATRKGESSAAGLSDMAIGSSNKSSLVRCS